MSFSLREQGGAEPAEQLVLIQRACCQRVTSATAEEMPSRLAREGAGEYQAEAMGLLDPCLRELSPEGVVPPADWKPYSLA